MERSSQGWKLTQRLCSDPHTGAVGLFPDTGPHFLGWSSGLSQWSSIHLSRPYHCYFPSLPLTTTLCYIGHFVMNVFFNKNSYHVLSAYYVPSTDLKSLYSYYTNSSGTYDFHFTNEGTKVREIS